jgi:phospholipid/cholesterol/gamma-HCH transport system substrate-binding protein
MMPGFSRRFPKSFAERNRVVIAIIGLVAMTAAFLVTFNAEAMPVIGGGDVHSARFAEAGGLREGDEVRVAGVKVGKVIGIDLDGSAVEVRFRIKDVALGDQTTAAVKVKTLLGQKYLAIDPLGRRALDGPIPQAHTTTPYDVNAAMSDLSTTIDEIDTHQLEKSFRVLGDAFENTPKSVRTMLAGLTDLSRTISSRDDELGRLFESTSELTGTLKDRNAEFASIINQGNLLLGELQRRRKAVKHMLRGTAVLGVQLRKLVEDNEEQLRPALRNLDRVSAILQRNQTNLETTIEKLAPYYRVLASATGNGRWIDSYICGLFDAQHAPVLDSDAVRDCQPGGAQ